MKKIFFILSFIFVLFFYSPLIANQGVPVTWDGEFKTGTREEEVLKEKGEPDKKIGPVGTLQVEKWYYGKEIVVIMNGYVIDSFYISWQR